MAVTNANSHQKMAVKALHAALKAINQQRIVYGRS